MTRAARSPLPRAMGPLALVMLLIGGCANPQPCDPALMPTGLSQPPPQACQVDGCSLAPDLDPAMTACCERHDIVYWPGGSRADRKQADLDFRQCLNAAGYHAIADVYYLGVRLGGTPHLPTPWRWGFGWDYHHGYD